MNSPADDDFDRTLRDWGDDLRASAPGISVPLDRFRGGSHRGTWTLAGSAAAVIAIGTSAGLLLAGGDSGTQPAGGGPTPSGSAAVRTAGPANAEMFAYDLLTVHDGDPVEVQGTVIIPAGGAAKLCAPRAVAAVGTTGPRTVPADCAGVAVIGIDAGALSDRYEYEGSVEGFARVWGTYRNRTITVTRQMGSEHRTSEPDWLPTQPPCTVKPGLYATGPDLEQRFADDVAHYESTHPGSIVVTAIVHPAPSESVGIIGTTDPPGEVSAAFEGRYCAYASDFTKAQVAAARAPFDAGMQRQAAAFPAYTSTGETVGPDGQALVDVQLDMITPEIAAQAEAAPRHLVWLDPWIRPIG